jgi:hypothetical protein
LNLFHHENTSTAIYTPTSAAFLTAVTFSPPLQNHGENHHHRRPHNHLKYHQPHRQQHHYAITTAIIIIMVAVITTDTTLTSSFTFIGVTTAPITTPTTSPV